ncbi:MAG: tetratricopeptide repeat protein [Marinilabiliaceae bacterium]|nr:tetratricopeptide repeat protein [Marinilabiliaceae bacterium]
MADTAQISALFQKSKMCKATSLDSAELYLNQGIQIADKIGDDKFILRGQWQLANVSVKKGLWEKADSLYVSILPTAILYVDSIELYQIMVDYAHLKYRQGDYEKAQHIYTTVVPFFKKHKHAELLVQCQINRAKIKIKQNDFTQAMSLFIEALHLAESHNQLNKQALIYGNMGRLYFKTEDYDKCLDCFYHSLAIHKKLNNKENIAVCHQSIGTIYIIKNDYPKAKEQLLLAGLHFKEAGLPAKYITVLNNLGVLHKRQKHYQLALKNYEEILTINQTIKNNAIEGNTFNNISQVYTAQGKYELALKSLQKALKAYQQHSEQDLREAYLNMSGIYELKQDYKNAYKWHVRYKEHSDSIFDLQKFKEMEELLVKYESDKKALLIDQMKVESERNHATIMKNRIIIGGVSLFAIVLLISTIAIRRQNQLKIKSYHQLVKKSEELAQINAAKRQQALKIETPAIITNETNEKIHDKGIVPEAVRLKVLEHFNQLITEDKLYTNTDLTITQVAKQFETNTKYLSQIINETFECNFSNFINQLRIEEAQYLLKDHKNNALTLEVIGQMAGFKSKSVFNTSFKRITGVTPSFYKKQIQNTENNKSILANKKCL